MIGTIENLIKKEEELMIKNLFLAVLSGKNINMPKNPKKLFEKEEIEKLKDSDEKLFNMFFTKDAIDISLKRKLKSPENFKDYILFWIYYKIFDYNDQVQKICEEDKNNYFFLIDDLMYALMKEKPEEKKVKIEINEENPYEIFVNNKKEEIFKFLNTNSYTNGQFFYIAQYLFPISRKIWLNIKNECDNSNVSTIDDESDNDETDHKLNNSNILTTDDESIDYNSNESDNDNLNVPATDDESNTGESDNNSNILTKDNESNDADESIDDEFDISYYYSENLR